MPRATGLWKTATGLGSYHLYMADPWAEQAAFMGAVTERDGPKFLGLRLRIKNKQIRELEMVVGRPGSSDPLPKDLATVTPKALWQVPLQPAEHAICKGNRTPASLPRRSRSRTARCLGSTP